MHPMLFGMETELAFSAWQREGGSPTDPRPLLGEFFELAQAQHASLPDARGFGIYLANGARFYLDRGDHPEICTPECQSPADVVRWQLACERILTDLVLQLEKRRPDLQISLLRCNVDYSGTGVSWGCHENYQHRSHHREMAPNLIPHLVTRLIYTGAGGFDNHSDEGEFLISPRVPHFVQEVGADTTERGIYDTRDEPLSRGGFNRLHLICGESLCSELSTYLKIGTTALIVRLVDAGVCRGREFVFDDSLEVMRTISADPTLRARVQLADGRRLTALEIQAGYLAMVEAQLGADFMPSWAPNVCRRWRQVLDRLASDPRSLATSLDWVIKHALFRDRMQRAGLSGDPLRSTNEIGTELCEIDTRFGALSPRALFHALDEAGALSHRIPERESVEDAIEEPPAGARAEARGRAIRALYPERRRYSCHWDSIRDREQNRVLDLSDPFASTAEWHDRPRIPLLRKEDEIGRQINLGLAAYHTQDTPTAIAALKEAIATAENLESLEESANARFWCASALQDSGDLAEAERVLAPALEAVEGVSPATRLRVWTRQAVIQIERPAPLAEIERTLERSSEIARYAGGGIGRSRNLLNEASLFGARGENAAGIRKAREALNRAASDSIAFNIYSYLRRLVTIQLRAGRLRSASKTLANWRGRTGRALVAAPFDVALAVAESNLALGQGRPHDAFERAAAALEHSTTYRRHRTRVYACVTYLEAAVASGMLDDVEPVLQELRGWHDIQIGELRLEILCAEARVENARGKDWEEARRSAREEAERIDGLLECGKNMEAWRES